MDGQDVVNLLGRLRKPVMDPDWVAAEREAHANKLRDLPPCGPTAQLDVRVVAAPVVVELARSVADVSGATWPA